MSNFDNYYKDRNGNIHRDIPIGTSPADAYVRTNMKLKSEINRIEDKITETNEHIDTEITRVNESVTKTSALVSSQLETAVGNLNQNIEEVSGQLGIRISTEITAVNDRVDNIIANNNNTEGNSELIDIRTGADGTVYASAGAAVRGQISAIDIDINSYLKQDPVSEDKTVFFDKMLGENVFNINTITPNKQITADGTITDNDSYSISDYILVPKNTRIDFCYTNDQNERSLSYSVRRLCVFDTSYNNLPEEGSDSTVRFWTNTTGNDVYIRFQSPNEYINHEFSAKIETDTEKVLLAFDYVPYQESWKLKEKYYNTPDDAITAAETAQETADIALQQSDKTENSDLFKLFNKIVCVGDSLTAGAYGINSGVDVHTENYPYYLQKMHHTANIVNMGYPGMNAKSAMDKYLSNITSSLDSTVDLVIFWDGTNDPNLKLSGQYDNLDTDNYYGDKYCYVLEQMMAAAPNALFVLVNVPENRGVNSSGNPKWTNIAIINQSIASIAEHYGLYMVNLHDLLPTKDGSAEKIALYQPYDSLHFGKWGYWQIAKTISSSIGSYLKQNPDIVNNLLLLD